MIEFDCPACGSRLYIKDEFAGKRGKCPHCSDVIDVPTRSVPPAEPPEPAAPVPTARAVPPRRVSVLGITGLVLGVLGMAMCWMPAAGLPLALAGLIVAAAGLVLSTTGNKTGASVPVAGMVVSFVAVIAGAVMLWTYKSTADYVFDRAEDIRYDAEDAESTP